MEATLSGCVQMEQLERRVAQLERECVRQSGCEQLGVAHSEGTRWTHPNDSCLECHCQVRSLHAHTYSLTHSFTHSNTFFPTPRNFIPVALNSAFISDRLRISARRSLTINAKLAGWPRELLCEELPVRVSERVLDAQREPSRRSLRL